nr:unnamed protein product [Callosobruchus analis]
MKTRNRLGICRRVIYRRQPRPNKLVQTSRIKQTAPSSIEKSMSAGKRQAGRRSRGKRRSGKMTGNLDNWVAHQLCERMQGRCVGKNGSAQPCSRKVFVAKRVAEIQSLTEECKWRHVPSGNNPVDIISRQTTEGLRVVKNVTTKKDSKITGTICHEELEEALLALAKQAQKFDFIKEIRYLQKHTIVIPNSKLESLCPFLDKRSLIRVGSKIASAAVPYDNKFPIVLS